MLSCPCRMAGKGTAGGSGVLKCLRHYGDFALRSKSPPGAADASPGKKAKGKEVACCQLWMTGCGCQKGFRGRFEGFWESAGCGVSEVLVNQGFRLWISCENLSKTVCKCPGFGASQITQLNKSAGRARDTVPCQIGWNEPGGGEAASSGWRAEMVQMESGMSGHGHGLIGGLIG